MKRHYARTNKRKAASQIAKHQRHQAIVQAMASKDPFSPKEHARLLGMTDLPYASSEDHHHIAESQRSPCDILGWVHKNQDDPNVKVRFREDDHDS